VNFVLFLVKCCDPRTSSTSSWPRPFLGGCITSTRAARQRDHCEDPWQNVFRSGKSRRDRSALDAPTVFTCQRSGRKWPGFRFLAGFCALKLGRFLVIMSRMGFFGGTG
jgi:hypothetical protein